MGWSVSKTLKRTGAPAIGFFVAKSAWEIAQRGPEDSIADIVGVNAALIGIVWLAVAVFFWIATRLIPVRR